MFPAILARTESSAGAGTSNTVNYAQAVAGQLCVIFYGINDTAQVINSITQGFTDLTNTNATFHIAYKFLDGSEGTSCVFAHTSNTKAAAIAYTIQWHDPTIAPEFSTVATGTSTGPDATTCTPTGGAKDYLWLSAFRQNGEEADDDTWCNSAPATPSAFGNLVQVTTGTSGLPATNGSVAAADLASNASSLDAGAFNTDQSLAWRAYTVAVHPSPWGPLDPHGASGFFGN